jgi:hypothetical protein
MIAASQFQGRQGIEIIRLLLQSHDTTQEELEGAALEFRELSVAKLPTSQGIYNGSFSDLPGEF